MNGCLFFPQKTRKIVWSESFQTLPPLAATEQSLPLFTAKQDGDVWAIIGLYPMSHQQGSSAQQEFHFLVSLWAPENASEGPPILQSCFWGHKGRGSFVMCTEVPGTGRVATLNTACSFKQTCLVKKTIHRIIEGTQRLIQFNALQYILTRILGSTLFSRTDYAVFGQSLVAHYGLHATKFYSEKKTC